MTPSGTGLVAQGYPISKVSRMKLLLWRPWNNIAAKRDTFITYKSRKRRAHLTPDLKRDLKTVPERGNYSDSEKKTNINKVAREGLCRARCWRTRLDLELASPDLPLNAGWETHQADCRTWLHSMKRKKPTLSKQEHSKLFHPTPFSHLFIYFPAASSLASRASLCQGLLRYSWKIHFFSPPQNKPWFDFFISLYVSQWSKDWKWCCFTYLRRCLQ